MKWNLRMAAAERGIWKSTELRRMFADAGLEISAGKMSALWTGTPTTIRLDDLDVICEVLDCEPTKLLIREPAKVAALRALKTANKTGTSDDPDHALPSTPAVQPRLGRNRTRPPE
jgi:putative transcriptional regulator